MTKVTIYKENEYLVGFSSVGHADERGESIGISVCAGISVLTQTAILSLHKIANISEEDMMIEQEDGYLSLRLLNHVYYDDKVQIILQAMTCGLTEIHNTYQKYISFQIQEV